MLVCACVPAGVLTSDPRLVQGARPVPLLTYDEATELAFFGATVLHPQAMQPAFQQQFHNGHKLAVRVKNSYNRYARYCPPAYRCWSACWACLSVCCAACHISGCLDSVTPVGLPNGFCLFVCFCCMSVTNTNIGVLFHTCPSSQECDRQRDINRLRRFVCSLAVCILVWLGPSQVAMTSCACACQLPC